MERIIEVGKTYKHFKGEPIKVLFLAKHSETLEDLVVYKHLDDNQIWVRPYHIFNSKVDKEKYPNITQEYRFERIDE